MNKVIGLPKNRLLFYNQVVLFFLSNIILNKTTKILIKLKLQMNNRSFTNPPKIQLMVNKKAYHSKKIYQPNKNEINSLSTKT